MIIYLVRFLSNFALAAFYPFLAVWLTEASTLSPFNISIIISTGIFMSRIGGFILASYIDHRNKNYCIKISSILLIFIVIIMSILKIYHINNLQVWFFLAVLWGIFVSVISVAILAYVADKNTGYQQKLGFSYINLSINLSAGLAPITSSIILIYHQNLLPFVPIIALALTFIFSFGLENDKVASKKNKKINEKKQKNKSFVILCIINFLTFISYSQLINIFPMYAKDFVDKRIIGLLFFTISMVLVLTQIPLIKFVRNMHFHKIIIVANALTAFGTLALITIEQNNIILCFFAVILIALAMVLYIPLYQSMGIHLFSGDSTYALALVTLMWGLGEGLSVIFGFYFIEQHIGKYSYFIGSIAPIFSIILTWIYRDSFPNTKIK